MKKLKKTGDKLAKIDSLFQTNCCQRKRGKPKMLVSKAGTPVNEVDYSHSFNFLH
ncbi:hypothetical protein FHEFKHOI_01892 [Candidatus Methanoperedenaceae archaeon GB50]|nr:hypothetical protein FHEFKHOI_01892 [Candidatus Methanoperedenaceae archaeon GB50]